MAKVSYLLIPPEFDFAYSKALKPNDRFAYSSVRRNAVYRTRRRIKGLTQKSLLPQIKLAWDNLTTEEKENWALAGAECNLSGYRLFVKDKVLRIKNGLSGNTSPQVLAQAMAGVLTIESPATHIKITQLHPSEYWVRRKVPGSKSMFEPVLVKEDFALPLELKVSYASFLDVAGDNPRARFYAVVYSLYQGRTIENVVSCDFELENEGQQISVVLNDVMGAVKSYTLFIELQDCQGLLMFDNIKAIHSGQNWCRDSACNDIDQSFTKAFYQVPKHWAPVELPEGAFFGSEYLQLLIE